MPEVTITNLAEFGVISDVASFQTPSNAWSSARNVSFENGGVKKSGDITEVMVPAVSNVNKIYAKDGAVYYTNTNRVYRATGIDNRDISKQQVDYPTTDEWYITELSNVLVFANDSVPPQMLLPQSLEMQDLPTWGFEGGTNHIWRTDRIRAYKNFLIAMGVQEDGIEYKQRVRWSDLALPNQAPTSWDATSTTNSAGFNDLTEALGTIVEGSPLGDAFVIYTTNEVYLMQYIGGNEIFSFRKIFDNLSILAPECACQINGGHFLVTTSDIVIHNGSSWTSIIVDRIKNELFEAISSSNNNKVKVIHYPAKQEVWVLYPSSSSSALDRAAIYNLTAQTWTFRDLPNATAIAYGVVPTAADGVIDTQTQLIDDDNRIINGVGQDFVSNSLFIASASLKWYAVDEGASDINLLPSTVIKEYIDFDEWEVEPHRHKMIKTIYPQFVGNATVFISVGTSENPYDPPRWSDAVEFNTAVDRQASFRVTGRYISIRFQSYGPESWTLLSYSIEGDIKGRR